MLMNQAQTPIEGSTFSKSTTSGASTQKEKTLRLSNVESNGLFPLYDHLNYVIRMPAAVTDAISIYFFLQLSIITLWPTDSFYAERINDKNSAWLSVICYIFFFTDPYRREQSLLINMILSCVVGGALLSWFCFLYFFFKYQKTFWKWMLWVSKVWLDIITNIVLIPSAVFIGNSLLSLYYFQSITNWIFFFLSIITFAIIMTTFWINTTLTSRTIKLSRTPFPMLDNYYLLLYAIVSCLTVVLMFVLTIFPIWMIVVMQIVHLIIMCALAYTIFGFLFYRHLTHSLYSTAITTSIILDIILIILTFVGKAAIYIPFIIFVTVFIVSLASHYLINEYRLKHIHTLLKAKEIDVSESQKSEYFDELGLNNGEGKYMMFVRAGFIKASPLFGDMSLIQYATRNNHSTHNLISMMQIVAFFPSENRILNSIFNAIMKTKHFSIGDNFIIYQTNRIKSLRASSTSIEANELLNEMKTINFQCEANTNALWSMQDCPVAYLYQRAQERKNAEIQWNQAIDKFPNNSKLSYEYSRFLSETITDLEAAIYQQERGDLIEGGKNFAIDDCFRSFVRIFPHYLLDEIVAINGKKIDQKKGKGSTNSIVNVSASDSFTIDAEMEESIGKKIFSQSRMRLALFHALEGRKSSIRIPMIIASLVTLICTIAIFVFFYIFMTSSFKFRNRAIHYLYSSLHMKFMECVEVILIWSKWASGTHRLYNRDLLGDIAEDDRQFRNYVLFTHSFESQVMNNIELERTTLSNLINSLVELSSGGTDVYSMSATLLSETCDLRFCVNGKEATRYASTFKDKVIYLLYQIGLLIAYKPEDIYLSNVHCEIMVNTYDFNTDSKGMFYGFNGAAAKDASDLEVKLFYCEVIVPFCIFATCLLPMIILITLNSYSMKHLLNLLISLPKDTKESAEKPIRIEASFDEKEQPDHLIPCCSQTLIFGGCYIVIIICITLFASLFALDMQSSNATISQLNSWFLLAARRLANSGDICLDILNSIVLNGSVNPSFTNRSFNIAKFKAEMKEATDAHFTLLRGSSTMSAFIDFDSAIDSLHFQQRCHLGNESTTVHDLYRCASVSQQWSIFNDLSGSLMSRIDSFNGVLANENSLNIIHILTAHLWDSFMIVCDRMVDLVSIKYSEMTSKAIIYVTLGILSGVLTVVCTVIFVNNIDSSYQVALSLIKRIAPANLTASKDLMDYLLDRKTKGYDKSMTISQSIVHNSYDAILCTNKSGVIEMINPSVSSILGYTPDQLLGQSILELFKPVCVEDVQKRINLICNGQSSCQYQDHYICLSDSTTEVTFSTTIIGIKGDSGDVASFVFILSDESEILRQQKEAENAKAKSEKLLYQILPKDIVVRLNRGEKDISFSVPHASIIFIDIVKFSEYASNLTPQEIMGNLGFIFGRFDSIIAQFPRLVKIKLIGDVYMAAAGLFGNPNDSPNGHAEDTCKFALECLAEMEEINIKLTASLDVRIGINTGGPLLAGVLGTDKPTFDIIGDPINIAARLQSTDLPGRVQISASTKAAIEGTMLQFEERGEVFLKGKGKQMTYLINVPNFLSNNFSLGTSRE